MAVIPSNGVASDSATPSPVQHLDLSYDPNNSEESVRKLVYKIQPKWRDHPEQLEFVKFTDGITNTLLKIARKAPDASKADIDADSVLMRAYGNNTDLIIDRDREAKSHALLADRGMAPPLLARFRNGLLYRFIPGKPSTPDDLMREPVWRGVAQKLGEWHARVPVSAVVTKSGNHTNGVNGHLNGNTPATNGLNGHTGVAKTMANGAQTLAQGVNGHKAPSRTVETRVPRPNLWTVLQSWIDALPTDSEKNRARRELLQQEVERSFRDLDNKMGIGEHGLVFGHCDLLSGNVIILPTPSTMNVNGNVKSVATPVTFIDYEYATPCPAAFDIANHFAEWAGFDLDYNKIPTRSVRRGFLEEYVTSYNRHARVKINETAVAEWLFEETDRFRGMAGLYWGIWAIIQSRISEIDFDYASYAEERLDEYWAWRAARDGSHPPERRSVALREKLWNSE